MSTVTERVAAGAAFLDEHDPQWWRADVERAIDLADFDLESTSSCVLGQRCPLELHFNAAEWMSRYDTFAIKLSGIVAFDRSDLSGWAVPLGFQAGTYDDSDDYYDEYDELTAEWKRIITGRRAAS